MSGAPRPPEETFDEFCERLNVTPDEYPHAFAAWLARNFDWDGRYERADGPDHERRACARQTRPDPKR